MSGFSKLFILGFLSWCAVSAAFGTGAAEIAAHTSTSWLAMSNGLSLKDYSAPTPVNLPVRELILSRNIAQGEVVKFTIRPEELADLTQGEVSATWRLSDGREFNGREVEIPFSQTGSYFLDVDLMEVSTKKVHATEGIMLQVGSDARNPEIKIDGETIDAETGLLAKEVVRSRAVSFVVVDPDDDYEYSWDFLDTVVSDSASASHSFYKTKLPGYVLLRSTNKTTRVYTDTFIRIDSKDPPGFEINMPPAPRDLLQAGEDANGAQELDQVQKTTSAINVSWQVGLLGVSILVLVALVLLRLYLAQARGKSNG